MRHRSQPRPELIGSKPERNMAKKQMGFMQRVLDPGAIQVEL